MDPCSEGKEAHVASELRVSGRRFSENSIAGISFQGKDDGTMETRGKLSCFLICKLFSVCFQPRSDADLSIVIEKLNQM